MPKGGKRPGAGRKPNEIPSIRKTFALAPNYWARLENTAKSLSVSTHEVLRRLIARGLDES